MSGRARLKQAIHTTAKKHAVNQQTVTRGTITQANPLTVEAFGFSIPLTEADDLDLSGWMRLYRHVVGLNEGDMVLLLREDSWVLFDIVTDENVEAKFDAWDTKRGPS